MGKRNRKGQSGDPLPPDSTDHRNPSTKSVEPNAAHELPKSGKSKNGAYTIAIAVLGRSPMLMLSMYVLLIAPRLALTLLSPRSPEALVALRFVERILELGVLLVIVRLFLKEILGTSHALPRLSIASTGVFFLIGLLIWITLLCPSGVIPFEIAWTAASPGGIGPALFMALPAGFVWYLHFFWAFTLPLPRLDLPTRITLCRELVSRDPWAPIKSVLGPSALQFLPSLIILAPYPDGRSLELCLMGDLLSGIQWLLCSLLTTAFGVTLLSHVEWERIAGSSEAPLPSFQKHAELAVQSSAVQSGARWLIRPRIACQTLAICTLIWAANLGRLSNLPPSPSIAISRVWFDEHQLMHVDLEAQDAEFRFRGFRPLQFRIADSEGQAVFSTFPERATINGTPEDVRVFFPVQPGPISLQLVFRDQRLDMQQVPQSPSNDSAAAPQWFLWYGAGKLTSLPTLDENAVAPQLNSGTEHTEAQTIPPT